MFSENAHINDPPLRVRDHDLFKPHGAGGDADTRLHQLEVVVGTHADIGI